MKASFIKTIWAFALGLLTFLPLGAKDYVAVAKNGNVYDDANAKYITVNQNNDVVTVIPGMIFVTTEHTPGWYKVEYSPGLHAFIPEQITATEFKNAGAGVYEIKNNPGNKLSVEGEGSNLSANFNGKNYKGSQVEDYMIFVDDQNNIAFSVIDLGDGPIAITYDNSVTKFF